eukprot:c10798_g1_i1.p1 GENE.c10798_g1_i1~~c10798_g1_i1.p1  ORF type:complete len:688 (-),score=142.00 c10798_g1_i1:142-2094(-)
MSNTKLSSPAPPRPTVIPQSPPTQAVLSTKGNPKHICPDCNKEFPKPEHLKQHMEAKHMSNTKLSSPAPPRPTVIPQSPSPQNVVFPNFGAKYIGPPSSPLPPKVTSLPTSLPAAQPPQAPPVRMFTYDDLEDAAGPPPTSTGINHASKISSNSHAVPAQAQQQTNATPTTKATATTTKPISIVPPAGFDPQKYLAARDLGLEGSGGAVSGIILGDREHRKLFRESAFFGTASSLLTGCDFAQTLEQEVYLNIHEPFCIVAVGVQGAGKSHSLACILESCLVPLPESMSGVVELDLPMNALVLHYDTNVSSICEVTGLISTSPAFAAAAQSHGASGSFTAACSLPRERMLVLVSPSFYKQRRMFYGEYCTVRPLLFRWASLTADHIRLLMRLSDDDNQLYVAVLLNLLRSYQRQNSVPSFTVFMADVAERCNIKGQQSALQQRLALLESFVLESSINTDLARVGVDLEAVDEGMLAVVDLTDPLLSKEEACCIFQVLTEQYRAIPSIKMGGKLLVLDEAHKYMESKQSRGLSSAIVDCARLMRHDGMRLIISTQSPLSLAPELLELCSMTLLHRFYSQDWLNFLSKKLPIPAALGEHISRLDSGQALVFAARHRLGPVGQVEECSNLYLVAVRKRITSDRGTTRTNRVQK